MKPSDSLALGHFVTARTLLDCAAREGRAVAALNFYNAETLRAHVDAAKELGVPLVLQTTEATLTYLGLRVAVALARAAAEELEGRVALQLDHGKSRELVTRALDAGFSAVMIDGSELPYEQNVELTASVVELAHAAGASVEGEIGHVARTTSPEDDRYTEPDLALRFARDTGVDALAVAVGTAHGFYRGEVALDFARLSTIHELLGDLPLVLHGGSGVPDNLLRRAIACGIRKVNFGTEVKDAFTSAVRNSLLHDRDIDLRRTFAPAVAAARAMSRHKLQVCWG